MKVLLLNASYEIHNIITWKDAVKLLINGKAEKPSGYNDDYLIGTASGYFKLPKALVLAKYTRIPHRFAIPSKRNILKRDKYLCQYCGKKLTDISGTIDHIHPVSKGGKTLWTNVVAACYQCNNKKDNFTINEVNRKYNMKLRSEPKAPTHMSLVTYGVNLDDSWESFIY